MSDRHYCLKCGRAFNYCRPCVFKPNPYKEAGYCSKECCEADLKEVIQKDVEVVVTDEDISTSKEEVVVSSFFSDNKSDIEEKKSDIPTVTQNIYKSNNKKKNKYKENIINENEQNNGEDIC